MKLVPHGLHETTSPHVPEISTPVSLTVIGGVLAITTVTSVMATRKAAARNPGTADQPEQAENADTQG